MWFCLQCTKELKPKQYYCNKCSKSLRSWAKKKESNWNTIEKVYLDGYGHVEKSRLREMERRVVLNYNPADGTYDVGRLSENGKVQERTPDFRP